MSIEQAIIEGCERLDLRLSDEACTRLAAYLALLERWNRAYNLTAVREPEAMVVRHLLDSLSILPWLEGPRVLDVGSGAGLPGIPLAVARPEYEFCLLDSNGKRTRFLTQATAELRLPNVSIVRSRVEDYQPVTLFNSIVSRAFATLAELVADAGRLCAPTGRLLAMKGVLPDDELARLPSTYQVVGVYPLRVPHLDAERHLVHLAPASQD
ncbi:MAG TPA: 16S rRNA (guanine(527)-N(7))-methyltransferase RsmG [Candidatus Contendobacter sp.]|jgi:16S rRNA (guanine527-N7)-methyltransferase|nr:16S rRNA (guanine(527)-N(7))-methyltransferase RsmG [Candidatus Contendobacter sp.]HRZ22679.1 16S rRNA (guanine(527)-N(7))-methyltransferase RsmG [Candidatus Contendobacter sp.]HRZ53335.1 16S rRNA (guanine(527)-N(7))-methyltransferase RsmG [Candidatus Contendobacter sp.]